MSTYYWIYSEAKVDGRWVSIDKPKKSGRIEETYFSSSRTFFEDAFDEIRMGNSQRISIEDLSEELEDSILSSWYVDAEKLPADVCDCIKKELLSIGISETDIEKNFEYHNVVIPLSRCSEEGRKAIRPEIRKQFSYKLYSLPYGELAKAIGEGRYTHHGWVSKDAIAMYETGEIDELWPLSLEELAPIANAPKETAELLLKGYEYMEWDNPYDWLFAFKEVRAAVDERIDTFMKANGLEEKPEVRIIAHSEY